MFESDDHQFCQSERSVQREGFGTGFWIFFQTMFVCMIYTCIREFHVVHLTKDFGIQPYFATKPLNFPFCPFTPHSIQENSPFYYRLQLFL